MTASEIIDALRRRGVRLQAKDGDLIADAPEGAITDDLAAAIRENKEEIVQRLTEGVKGLVIRVRGGLERSALSPQPLAAPKPSEALPAFQPGQYVASAQMIAPADMTPAEAKRWQERADRMRQRQEDAAFCAAFGQPPYRR